MRRVNSSSPLLQASNLQRSYGDTRAVQGMNLTLNKGQVLGLLGVNGAGKSTTMQMISGTLAPDSGVISVCGADLIKAPRDAKQHIGYLPEQPPLYRELSVDEYLRYCGRLHGIQSSGIAAALGKVKSNCGLAAVGRRLIGNLSKGYQQRVGIAQAIVHSPSVVILDEPTVGLDPLQIREIRDLIIELGTDHGVILSSHILPEIQATCSHVKMIHRGQSVFSSTMSALGEQQTSSGFIIKLNRPPAVSELAALDSVTKVQSLDGNRFLLEGDPNPEQVAETAVQSGWGLTELTAQHKTLEQIFVELSMGTASHEGASE